MTTTLAPAIPAVPVLQAAPAPDVSRFQPVGLAELDARAALQVRRDRKYAVSETTLAALLAGLPEGTRALEIGGRREFDYTSTYFDTPERTSFYLTARPRRRRYKLRTRRHGPGLPLFFEVKTRGGRGLTIKDRLPLDGDDPRPALPQALTLVAERGCLPPALNSLAPCLDIAYRRSTLLLPDGSRVTIDRDLAWAAPGGPALTLPGLVVVETKTLAQATAADRLLWAGHHRPQRLSKFGVGLCLTEHLPDHRWHRLFQPHSIGRTS
jgi:hypothetical protein